LETDSTTISLRDDLEDQGALRSVVLSSTTNLQGAFYGQEAALKVLFLAVSRAVKKWSWLPVHDWKRPCPKVRFRVKTGGVIMVER
jgi:hypothetical protein